MVRARERGARVSGDVDESIRVRGGVRLRDAGTLRRRNDTRQRFVPQEPSVARRAHEHVAGQSRCVVDAPGRSRPRRRSGGRTCRTRPSRRQGMPRGSAWCRVRVRCTQIGRMEVCKRVQCFHHGSRPPVSRGRGALYDALYDSDTTSAPYSGCTVNTQPSPLATRTHAPRTASTKKVESRAS